MTDPADRSPRPDQRRRAQAQRGKARPGKSLGANGAAGRAEQGGRTPAAERPAVGALPLTLRAAVAGLSVEAVALGVLGVVLIVKDATGEAGDLRAALFLTGFTILYAVVLGALARALARRRGGVRGLAIALQLMLAPVGYSLLSTGAVWLGVLVAVPALAVIALLMAPPTARALGLADGAANG
ncbi:hypothetical protein [Rhizomonospora bruguierae]|uniref:hypothetical protein n=1 Tax=Rhizomonospora bruguierae TaxID=1581705 RepID=UPI0020BD7D26|nr:hypothetical protein [Micromonospora sp. NBRC 107566]